MSVTNRQPQQNNTVQTETNNPSFKSIGAIGGTLDLFGRTMQGIENGGFLASFLIQDALGMTAPRVGAAFLRDKEVTGHYNKQEGFEVLGREGLTGPIMMAMAPIVFTLAAKVGRSTSVNSQLIKRFGNSLKEMVSDSHFRSDLLNDKTLFKKEYYNKNIKEILSNTLGKKYATEESVNFIVEEILKMENISPQTALPKNILGIKSKNKYRQNIISNITDYINDIKYKTSSNLEELNKVKLGSKDDIKSFSIQNTIEAMIKYSDDAISLNKNLNDLNSNTAESLKNKSLAKRFLTNITTIASTLGVLSVLPKLYIKSDLSPGARTALELKENHKNENSDNKISFKAKGPDKSILEKLGKALSKLSDKDFWANELEYNGHNFTNTLMAGLSVFGLLFPRGIKAYNRAQVDENGKKDFTEIYEILIRDLTSSLSVIFAVPMLTKAAVSSYENKSGFVLMNKDRTKSGWRHKLDLLNPYNKTHVLKNSEINALYGNINSKDKMLNFCDFINRNGGDLEKILKKSGFANELFNENKLSLDNISKNNKTEKNLAIIKYFKELTNSKETDDFIAKIMDGNIKQLSSKKILRFARGLNSIPGVITTFLISPYILGWLIPRLTYANTRRIHENNEQNNQT